LRTTTPHPNTPSVHQVPRTTSLPPPQLIRPPLAAPLLKSTLLPSTQPWRPRPSTRCRSTSSAACPMPIRGPHAPVPARKHGGSGGARARTRPSARTAHRANGVGRDGGSLFCLAPPLSPNFLASRCPSPLHGIFLRRFHAGSGPSARASTSLPAGERWRIKTPAMLLPARTHDKRTPRHDTGGAPTSASCTLENMMTARTEVHRLELGSNCLCICFASLHSLWSARCRSGIRVWTQLLMPKLNATLLAVF